MGKEISFYAELEFLANVTERTPSCDFIHDTHGTEIVFSPHQYIQLGSQLSYY